jgi:CTP:molybdopterin cytidylyltransferase MocA
MDSESQTLAGRAASGSVAAVILAAGESRRFGSAKQLALLDGRTLLEHVLLAASAAGLRPIVAVVPVWLTRPASWNDADLVWVRNAYPERGMGLSLRIGLGALPDGVEAAVILLGDQPRVTVQAIDAVLAARGSTPLVAAHADGRLAPPVLIARDRPDVAHDLRGDVPLRQILAASPDAVTAVEIGGHAPDVDTPDDLARA